MPLSGALRLQFASTCDDHSFSSVSCAENLKCLQLDEAVRSCLVAVKELKSRLPE